MEESKKPDIHKEETVTLSHTHTGSTGNRLITEAFWSPGHVILSDYIVESVLGKGGMGIVYRVQHRDTQSLFAVKTLRAGIGRISQRRKLLRELRTWMDLPEHPNLARCNYFRTIDDQLAVFAEYINGGTLSDWIAKGPHQYSDIIDVMIQLAWALHAAHINGVIHQDVKPSNVLMTTDGSVKLTDFGLASISHSPDLLTEASDSVESHLVTSNGMTPAYSSPEQLNGDKLSFKTDIWSYGMTMMEVFAGKATWLAGAAGPVILQKLSRQKPVFPGQSIPGAVQALLMTCFQREPTQRWGSMLEIVAELEKIHRDLIGIPYERKTPEFVELPARDSVDRQSLTGDRWEDPVTFLKKAMSAAKRGHEFIEMALPERKGSRKVQALVDLEVYEMAERILLELTGRQNYEVDDLLARLYYQKSFVSEYLDDNENALIVMNKMIGIHESNSAEVKNEETVSRLVNGYLRVGTHYHHVRQFHEARQYFDKAIDIFNQPVFSDWVSALNKSMIYVNRGIIALEFRQHQEAADFCDSALTVLTRFLETEFSEKAQLQLGKTYSTRAGALAGLMDFDSALDHLTRGTEILQDLVHRTGNTKAEMNIIYNLLNKSMILVNLERYEEALDVLEQGIEPVRRMIEQDDRREMRFWLATILLKKGSVYQRMAAFPAALEQLDHSIAIFEELIEQEGMHAFTRDLYFAYAEKAAILEETGDSKNALIFMDRIISILTRFDVMYQQVDFKTERALYLARRAMLKHSLKSLDGVLTDLSTAIPILAEAIDSQQPEYQEVLEAAQQLKNRLS